MPGLRCLYELHAPVWLARASERFGRTVTLGTVPDEAWAELASLGFDHVWVMGVWRRGLASRREALASDAMRRWRRTLPDLDDADVLGSPYSVHDYTLAPRLGDDGDLGRLRDQLHRLGLGLILDFVPNHLAVDHSWTRSHPERLVRGTEHAVALHPDWYFQGPGGDSLAHGRDPNFAPWKDTVQIDWTSAEAREALASDLIRIGELADGVRVDMAMLGLTQVVKRTWAEVVPAAESLDAEPWADVLARVRAARPGLKLIAEAYWGLEPELLALGFDHAYDKTVYDLLLARRTAELARYLATASSWLGRGVHFTENHDEERAQVAFGCERARAAAVVALTIPGVALIHDGQLEGARRRAPIHLARAAHEDVTPGEQAFYRRLLAITSDTTFVDGTWQPLTEENGIDSGLLGWSWRLDDDPRVVVVNDSERASSASLTLDSLLAPRVGQAIAVDELTGATVGVVRRGAASEPLHARFQPWGSLVLRLRPAVV